MTKSEEIKIKSKSTLIQKGKPNLPWWVELLFVQIGLPEEYLVKLLSIRTDSITHIGANRRRYILLLLGLLSIYYINPLINNAIHTNNCISEVKTLINNSKTLNDNTDVGSFTRAVNYCNGGKSLTSE